MITLLFLYLIYKKGSNIKIDVKCDVCGYEKKLSFRSYNKNINNGGYYSCSPKCCKSKTIKTMNSKYGVNYAIQLEDIRKKGVETCLSENINLILGN